MNFLQTSDFFRSHEGTAVPISHRWRGRTRLRIKDFFCDLSLVLSPRLRAARSRKPARAERILIVGIEVPSRSADIHDVVARLRRGSRHDISVSISPMLDQGKFANITAAISSAAAPLASFDWLVITDDDIAFPARLLDDMVAIAAAADLALSQPSHAFLSHATYSITLRRCGLLARRTNFVEIGPLTLIRADIFSALLPFPASRWCYGIDLLWSVAARRAGRRIGIIDATPIRHLRPVAASYDIDAARDEGQRLLNEHGVVENRRDLFELNDSVLET